MNKKTQTTERSQGRASRMAIPAGVLLILLLLLARAFSTAATAAGTPAHTAYLPLAAYTGPWAQAVGPGFDQPTSVANAGDPRLFIVERAGRVKVLQPDGRVSTFLDISEQVIDSRGEYGMFDIAFHPDFRTPGAPGQGLFYVSYTTGTDDGVVINVYFEVARFRVSSNPDVADKASKAVLFSLKQSFDVHKGGGMDFDRRDHQLYVGHGDDRLLLIAQDFSKAKGKVFRLDVDKVPPDVTGDARAYAEDEVWAIGLRNPWRIDVNEATNQIFVGEVGDQRWEELNIVPLSARYFNYGWPCREGPDPIPEANDLPQCQNASRFQKAVFQYRHKDGSGRCAIIGGKVYRPIGNPNDGRYIFADMCTGEIWALRIGTDQVTRLGSLPQLDMPVSIGEDYQGILYLATASTNAPIYRLSIP